MAVCDLTYTVLHQLTNHKSLTEAQLYLTMAWMVLVFCDVTEYRVYMPSVKPYTGWFQPGVPTEV